MLLDSSVLIAYFNTADVHHAEAKNVMDSLPAWLILQPILFETITVLHMKGSKSLAQSVLQHLLEDEKTKILEPRPEDLLGTAERYRIQKGSLTLYDLLLFTASKRMHIPFKSFDKKLNQLMKT